VTHSVRILLVFAALVLGDPAQTSAVDLWAKGARLEAIDAARKDVERDPRPETWTRLVGWQLAVHRHRAALADAERCGAPCDDRRAEALYHLGEYERAVPLLDERDPTACLWKIDALEALGRFAESDAVLDRARAHAIVDARFSGAEGRRHARNGDFAAAERAFRAALDVDPYDGEARFGLGRALVALGKKDEGLAAMAEHRRLLPLLDGVEFARRGVDLGPVHAPNWTALGDAERALGRGDRSDAAYRRAAELGRPEELTANALRWSRLYAEDRGDVQAAVDLLVRTSNRHPDARLLVRAGDLLLGARRASDAVTRFVEAQALRPNDDAIAKRLAAARAAEAR